MKEKIQEQIENTENIIETLPENNKDNRHKKVLYIEDEEKKAKELLSSISEEIKTRNNKLLSLKPDKKIEDLKKELLNCGALDLWTLYNTSFEKLRFDYYLYQLHRLYKTELVDVNNCIRTILEIFKSIGIELTEKDFDYHPYVAKYIDMIQKHYSEEELSSTFEQLYWKLPELINAIEINFKSIYLKYQSRIDKYFDKKHKLYLENHSDGDLMARKEKLIKQINYTREKDPYYIFNKFVDKEYLLNDYSESEISKKRQLYFSDKEYTFEFLLEFYQVLYDYKLILKYDSFLKDLKDTLNKVTTLKDVRSKALKKVNATEKQIKKLVGKGLLGRKKDPDSYLIKFKSLLQQVTLDYIELEKANFLDTIYNHFSLGSAVVNALDLISSNYLHFVNHLETVEENNDLDYLNEQYHELKNIMNSNNFVLLDKISLLDEYQLKQVIVDKYALDGALLTVEQLEKDNIEKTLSDIKILINNEYIIRSGIKLEDIKLYFDTKDFEL